MRVSCPACGAEMSLDALLNHEAARTALAQAYALYAPLGGLLIRYLALFRPLKRSLTMDRVASLMDELLPMIQAAKIERNRVTLPAPRETWCLAIEQMLAARDKLQLPLKSHGYLLEIIAGLAGKAQAGAEQQRRGETPVPSPQPAPARGEGETRLMPTVHGLQPVSPRARPETIKTHLAAAHAALEKGKP